jgi:hypothetical protein
MFDILHIIFFGLFNLLAGFIIGIIVESWR